MDSTLGAIIQLIRDICDLANSVAFNKYRCRDLAKRCEVFGRYISRLDDLDLIFVDGLRHTLTECKKYLIKTRSRSRIIYYFNASAIAQDYESLKNDLDGWMGKIDIEISMADVYENLERRKEQQRRDDLEFLKDLEKAHRHIEAAKQIIAADMIGEAQQEKTVMEADDIQIGNLLYNFSFGEVHEGLFQKKRLVTLRIINKDVDNYTLSIIKRGILLTWNLQDCEYILRTHGLLFKGDNWIIVSDKTSYGTLYGLLKLYELSKKNKIKIATSIAVGLLYMHRSNIIHKDLRSHNIAMDKDFTPKITGFEVCRDASNSTVQLQMDPYVKKWWSPERLAGLSSSKKSDVYAFGVLMYEISMGTKYVDKVDTISLDLESGRVDEKYSELIQKCLNKTPSKRPDLQLLVHELTELQAAYIPEVKKKICK